MSNVSCKDTADLQPPQSLGVPARLNWFTACLTPAPDTWRNEIDSRGCAYLGFKRSATEYQGLRWTCNADEVRMCLAGHVADHILQMEHTKHQLDHVQERVLHDLMVVLRVRDSVNDGIFVVHVVAAFIACPPGSGKSVLASKIPEACTQQTRCGAIVTPAGALAEVYRRRYLHDHSITAGAFHSVLEFWAGGDPLVFLDVTFDLVVVDEVQNLNRERLAHPWNLSQRVTVNNWNLLVVVTHRWCVWSRKMI